MNCEYHERYKMQVPATRVIEGSPMCERCYAGAHPLNKKNIPTGERGRKSVLTPAQVDEAKSGILCGCTQSDLSKRFGCSAWVIYRIKREMVLAGEMAPENRGKYAR